MEEQRPKKLLDQVHDAIRLKHYSIPIEQAYVGWIKRYILFHDVRHPAEMGAAELEAFLTHSHPTDVMNWAAAESTQRRCCAPPSMLSQAKSIQFVGNGTEVSLSRLALLQLTEAPSREKQRAD